MTGAPDAVTAETRPTFGGYLRGTEGIRGFLCLLIVWYHCYLYTSPVGTPSRGFPYIYGISRWQLGLSVFFMLSAFLLYRPFVQSIMRGTRRPAFGAYLANRFLRIFPAYWAILIGAAIAGVTIVWIPTHDIDFHLPTFLANLALVHNLHPSGMQTGVPPSWSLAVEWVFYLLLPLMVMLALRIGGAAPTLARRRVAVLVPAALLFVVGIIGREASRRTWTPDDPSGVLNTWHAVIDKAFPTWADLFALGMVIAVLRVDFEDGRLRLPWWWRRAALAGWIGISLPTIWLQATGRLDWQHYNLVMGVAIALFFCTVVLRTDETRPDPIMRFLTWRPMVWLGGMSLSIYLIHYPVIVFFIGDGIYQPGWVGMAFNWAFITVIVLALAYLSHRFIEVPFMRRKVRTKAEGPAPVADVAPAPAPAPAPAASRA